MDSMKAIYFFGVAAGIGLGLIIASWLTIWGMYPPTPMLYGGALLGLGAVIGVGIYYKRHRV